MFELKKINLKKLNAFFSKNGVKSQIEQTSLNYLLYEDEAPVLGFSLTVPKFKEDIDFELSNLAISIEATEQERVEYLKQAFSLARTNRRQSFPNSFVCYDYKLGVRLIEEMQKNVDKFNFAGEFYQRGGSYYVGRWDGKDFKIDEGLLGHVDLDQILGFDFNNLSNDEIIENIGFYRVTEEDFNYKKYIWFCGGVVYKMTLPDGKFYIGSTTKTIDKYNGSGTSWKRYIISNGFESDDIKKEILRDDFKTETEMREYEFEVLSEYVTIEDGIRKIEDEDCMNKLLNANNLPKTKPCPKCGGKRGNHKKWCSNNKMRNIICKECGGLDGNHKKGCSKVKVCPECGSYPGHHKKYCSHYKDLGVCPECGYSIISRRHAKTCSRYKEPKVCEECGNKLTSGVHKSWCSHYKDAGVCPECGYSKQSRRHAKTCSHYKELRKCPECGSATHHKDWCSRLDKSKKCPYCGSRAGHRSNCPKAPKKCPHCGSTSRHRKDCPLAKVTPPCKICGGKKGVHKKDCPMKKSNKENNSINLLNNQK